MARSASVEATSGVPVRRRSAEVLQATAERQADRRGGRAWGVAHAAQRNETQLDKIQNMARPLEHRPSHLTCGDGRRPPSGTQAARDSR